MKGLRLRGTKKFQDKPYIFYFFLSYMTLLYLLLVDFLKFDPLTVTGMAFYVNRGPKCQHLFPLVSD
jgi:hypothetical protein